MIVAKIKVSGVRVNTVYRTFIPAGIVGAAIEISYIDDIWQGLRKTVVFRGATIKDVVTDASIVTIPPEVVATPNSTLSVGIYGVNADGNLVVPTLWAELGYIRPATDPSGDTTTVQSTPVWAQIKQIAYDAKQQVLSLRNEADSGEFDGKPGDNGSTFTPIVSENGARRNRAGIGGGCMSIDERKNEILAKIAEMKAEGADLQAALAKLGVTDDEPVA